MNGSETAKTGGGPDRIISLLSWVLIGQIALAVLLKFGDLSHAGGQANSGLLSCNLDAVSKMTVVERSQKNPKETTTLVIQKGKEGWTIPGFYDFPVPSRPLNKLFAELKGLNKGIPLSTTKESAERFKVADDNFERSFSFTDEQGKTATLYLGTSPGIGQQYGRTADNNDIYSVELAGFSTSAKPDEWIDKKIVAVQKDLITGVDMGSFKLQQTAGNWTLTENGVNHTVTDEGIADLLTVAADFTITSVLGEKNQPSFNTDKPALTYTLETGANKTVSFSFSHYAGKPTYVLKVSNKPYYMEVDEWSVKRIQEMTPKMILQQDAIARRKQRPSKKFHDANTDVITLPAPPAR